MIMMTALHRVRVVRIVKFAVTCLAAVLSIENKLVFCSKNERNVSPNSVHKHILVHEK